MFGNAMQVCVNEQQRYVVRKMLLGDIVIVQIRTYTNLDHVSYCTPQLYGTAYCL
jgi:hypothetical protein